MDLNIFRKKLPVVILVICLSLFLLLAGCKKKDSQAPVEPAVSTDVEKTSLVSKSLADVIANRSGWNPILKKYYGQQMPNFTFTDIDGKLHNLTDYKGKNVLVVIWATWCMPCIDEVPHLITLRNIMSEDKLAIIAISNEPVDTVRVMAENKKMNYTVVSNRSSLPVPFSSTQFVPSAFFINPDGTLKLATSGSTHLGQMKAIILAE